MVNQSDAMREIAVKYWRLRWVAGVFERSGDLLALGGGMIGLALIVAVVMVGLHERQAPFRSMTPAHQADTLD